MGYEANKKWRKNNREKRRAQVLIYYEKHANNKPNSGNIWSHDEIRAILAEDRPGDVELSALLGRGVRAIQVKRAKSPVMLPLTDFPGNSAAR